MHIHTAVLCHVSVSLLLCSSVGLASSSVHVLDNSRNITYIGSSDNGVDQFINIRYGKDTGGKWRFKAPRSYMYPPFSVVNTTAVGPACPQSKFQDFFGGGVNSNGGIQSLSEDCLNLRIARPAGTASDGSLPVMVWIYGGSDELGNINNPLYNPQGLILSAAAKGFPIIYVAMNYRVNVFGFANSEALFEEGSLNGGLRDQRLALEWIQANINQFGGDPSSVTLFGQSDGATSVGLQLSAFGGKGDAPFSGAIMESGAGPADPGVSGNFTKYSTTFVAERVGCIGTDAAVLDCLREVPMRKLLKAVKVYQTNQSANPQDIFFPAVDGDFIPAAPSLLLRQGMFYRNVPIVAGWTYNDGASFTPTSIDTKRATSDFIQSAYPHLTPKTLKKLLNLYPTQDFVDTAAVFDVVSPEYFRAAEILRDVNFACPALFSAQQVAAFGSASYVYEFNVTAYDQIEAGANASFLGVIHTSEIPFVFNDVSLLSTNTTYLQMAELVSGSWAHFAATGTPTGNQTLQDWPVFEASEQGGFQVRVIGGPSDGVLQLGSGNTLVERCAFVNTAAFYAELQT